MSSQPTLLNRIVATIHQAHLQIRMIARWIAPSVLRIALALPFLRSGLTRWDSFLSLSPGTLFLFEEQFRLHTFGGEYALPAPDQLASLTATAEILLPILLIFGLATRFAALGLLVMTGVIQLVFPDGWANFHLYWAALALGVIAIVPGAISVDCGFRRMVNGFRPSGSKW
ncbi:DoxX family protein (plasmid) [Rhizobium sp. T1470]|uniref:DoxX family protein n=1 Tax=unclassified Rhizobium TaxID=2613769 RepID=UPI001AAE3A35|nr:DoxX family protein [Rhizobium sp. T1473]MCA0807202.1 DoxX family protein [Rhizobium sp. T1473]